jgi:CheY-like chemotaxis protein
MAVSGGNPGEQHAKLKTILVVEDDVDLGEFFVQILKDETPHQAILAGDGFQALKIVRNIKPDLFVLDYQLPSMNGIELYDQLHATEGLESVPALFMSANAPMSELKKRQVHYIRKPFELDDILQTVEKLLESQ